MSASWACAVTAMVSVIWLTYWCLTESVDCFHAGFFTIVMDLPGVKLLIWYGPSEMVCWSSCRLFGKYESFSTGRAEANGMASMYRKSLAGWISRNCSVELLTATRPEIVCEFWNAAKFAAEIA